MKQRCSRAIAHILLGVFALATSAGVSALSAQATGKIEGFVTADSKPLPGASVVVTGTALSGTADAKGYYNILNVPAGVWTIRATYIGYKPSESNGLRVVSGQTMTQDFKMEQQPVGLEAITVKAEAKNALVPRDQVTSRQSVNGDVAKTLPVDRISALLALQPGVVQVTNCGTNQPCSPSYSVRGSRTDEQQTYVDGVPIQNVVRSGSNSTGTLGVAINAFEDASITTGASSAEFGNAQGGVINITTRTGGSKFAGSLGYETGMLGLAQYGQGINVFQGSISGPLGPKGLTFFVSGRVEGNSFSNGGYRGNLFPSYSAIGIDTVYRVAKQAGVTTQIPDSVDVITYKYAATKGDCDNFSYIVNSSNPDIANNYGVSCHKNTTFSNPSTTYYNTDKLNYSFGRGSRISATYLFSGSQSTSQIADGRSTGSSGASNIVNLNWTQTLLRQSVRQVTLDAYLSYQWNTDQGGSLKDYPSSTAPLGIITHKLKYVYKPSDWEVDSTLMYNFLLNRPNRQVGIQVVGNSTYSSNQSGYGSTLPSFAGNGAGGGGAYDLSYSYTQNKVLYGKVDLDAQLDRYNRLKFGGEGSHFTINNFAASSTGQNTLQEHPVQYGAYAEDRLDLGDVVLVGGVRYDYYWSKAWRWRDFPVIATRPGFSALSDAPGSGSNGINSIKQDSLFCPKGKTSEEIAATGSVCPLIQDPSHDYLSPHIQVSFPVTEKTNFRLSYAQQVQNPNFSLLYQNSLEDINTGGANSRSSWGNDLDFGKTIKFEFGARHAFSDDMVLDVAVYNNDNVANPATKFAFPVDPIVGQPTRIYVAQNTDFGNTRGIDLTLDRRIGNYFNGRLAYSFQDSKNTGTDPSSYLSFFESLVDASAEPPTAALPSGNSRPHSLTAIATLTLPADWKKGTVLGSILNRVTANFTGRIASGTPYTRCDPEDAGSLNAKSGGNCGTLQAVTGYNGERLPMIKQLDARIGKDFGIGKYQFSAFLDARNFLNIKNVTSVWSITGTTSNGRSQAQAWTTDSSTFATYGKNYGFYDAATGNLNLPSTIAACGAVRNGQNSGAPQCLYAIRDEQRYGNGDHVYTLAEQRNASDLTRAPSYDIRNFVSGGRTIRFGISVDF